METIKILFYIFAGIFFILAISSMFISQPIAQNPCSDAPAYMARVQGPIGEQCIYAIENYPDPSISQPNIPLVVKSFSYNPDIPQGPFCDKTWYGYRFVSINDGGYGPILWSPWHIKSKSNENQVYLELGPGQPQHSISDGYILNIHRNVGSPNSDTQGVIIASLLGAGVSFPDTGLVNPISLKGSSC